jgi:N,N-dimethylformamidase beta subunit-like, C-terminal
MRARWPVLAAIASTTVVLTASSALHAKPLRTSAVHTVTGFTVEGADESQEPSTKPRIEAAFRRESYRFGSVGKLVIFSKRVRRVSVQLFRAGTEDRRISPRDEMYGTPVSALRQLGIVRRKQGVWVPIPDSPSGLYFAKLTGARQRVGYAPFIIRPRRLGEEHVAVVLPTLTWQAYNRQDDDRDGRADTWYADPNVRRVPLSRPFDQRGVPPNYKYYDQPFLRWLISTKRTVDYLAQSDVAEANGRRLAAAYDLLIFPAITNTSRAGVRRCRRVPQSRRQSDVPFGEQLLLEDRDSGQPHVSGSQVARCR